MKETNESNGIKEKWLSRISSFLEFEKMVEDEFNFREIICTPDISRKFSYLIIDTGIGLILSIIVYHGFFYFWKYPLSDLGALKTENVDSNIYARTVFDLTIVLSGMLMLSICYSFSDDILLSHIELKIILTFICAIGFFILITPDDFSNPIHEVGAALVFAMLWGLIILFSVELNNASLTTMVIVSQLLLPGTVLTYAFLFVINIPAEEAVQKFAVEGLMMDLWLTTMPIRSEFKYWKKWFEPGLKGFI